MSPQKETRGNNGGVKTSAGKAVTRYNAQKHAILRETTTDYEKTDVEEIYNELAEDIRPTGRSQELLVEVMASNVIRLQRIAKAESEIVKEALSPELGEVLVSYGHSYNPTLSVKVMEGLSLYSRYQTATENRIYRALAFLKQLKNYEQST